MEHINWNPPEPRRGLAGSWDRFVGPGATSAEEWLQLLGGLLLTGALVMVYLSQRELLNWSVAQTGIALLLALDLTGGIITNATGAAKRWYHRAGQHTLRAHMPFILVHGVHLLVVALLFRQMDWGFFVVHYLFLSGSAVMLVQVPLYLQRPISLTLFCGGLLLGMYLFTPTPGLEWFIPFFYLKLLVSHLVKEAPFAPEESR